MKHLMGIFLLLAGSAMAAGNAKLVVGEGSPDVCLPAREQAVRNATLAAQLNAEKLCDDYGYLVGHFELPGGEVKGNPRDVVSCLPCGMTDGSKPIQGFKCSVRFLPQACVRRTARQNAGGTFVPNADWNAKERTSNANSIATGSRNAKARPSEVQANPSQLIPQQAQECEALIKYRDAALTADMKKALRNFDEFKKVLILLDQLDKTIRFEEMKDDSRVLVELQILKTIGTAVKTFIPFAGAGAAVNLAAAGSRSFQAVIPILVAKTPSFGQAVLDGELKNYILKEWLAAINPEVKALNALVETADNIKETFETVEDTRNTLSVIEISSKSLRKQIITAEKKIKSKENEFLLINKARNEIALFCDETPMRPVKM